MSPNAGQALRRHAPAWPGHPVRRGPSVNHNRLGVLDRPVKPGDDTEGAVRAPAPNPAQLSHFATLFPFALSFGTTLERIAAESLTPD
ncbi:hypothetical protein ABIA06_004417 [Bradyrhizobium yuanmingense]